MRVLLTTIILTLLAQPLQATTNDELVGWCKPIADNEFEFEGLSHNQQNGAFLCIGFMMGMMRLAEDVCYLGDDWHQQRFGTSIASPRLMIKRFLNFMESEPIRLKDRTMPSTFIEKTCE